MSLPEIAPVQLFRRGDFFANPNLQLYILRVGWERLSRDTRGRAARLDVHGWRNGREILEKQGYICAGNALLCPWGVRPLP